MNPQTEAMKLALEALRVSQNRLKEFEHRASVVNAIDFNHEAITALKALAEQPAQTATYTCGVCGVSMQMEQPAPVQQEPVAWMTQARNFVHLMEFTEAEAKLYGWSAVYTSPPAQRKPLPDGIPSPDELEALSDGNSGMIFNEGFPTKLDRLACWLREYAAIEAAHGIKEKK